jgi:adenine-specific DNA methylase
LRPALRRAALASVAALAVAATVSACGTSSTSSISTLAPHNTIDHAELVKYPSGSVDRTFFEYWSNLQFHSWADVAAYYDPSFRDYIGTATLINAKKVGASSYPALKPELVRTNSGQGVTTVYYTVTMEDGTKELASMTWRKVGGSWQIIYDSRMDAELSQVAQEKVQLAEAGSTPPSAEQPVSTKALSAARAAAQLQARFLQQKLNLKTP